MDGEVKVKVEEEMGGWMTGYIMYGQVGKWMDDLTGA